MMKKFFPLYLAALVSPTTAQVIVDDRWADGDRLKTETEGELDADWWSSSSTSGNSVEVETGALGLVSGGSGRGIHGTFTPQTLEIGDTLVVTFTFTTSATVGTSKSGAFKIALMDFNNASLAGDLYSISGDPNPLYTDLPGYYVDFDVNMLDESDDTGVRKHNTPNTSGRFLSTSGEWASLGSSANADYSILANTEYVGEITLTRTNEDSMQIFGSLSLDGVRLDSFTATDASGIANNIGMLGFWANSSTFGSTNFSGDPDNGITFSNVKIEKNPEVNVNLSINDSFADGDRASTEAADASWWSSNSTTGNSVEVSLGEMGLVSGTAGRGIHGTFAPQILEIGETLVSTLTFTTPATVATGKGSALRFAVMDFNNPGLAADLLSSSTPGNENPLYQNLPGYMIDFDVNTGATADTTIREHNSPNTTGRFLGTTGEWSSMGSSGDAGYAFEANTEYTVEITATRTGDDSLEIFSSLSKGAILLDSYTASDSSGIANNFGMLGVWVNSNTFGSSSDSENPDNGITFSNVSVGKVVPPVEPQDPPVEITSFVRDDEAQTVTIEWVAEVGTTYFVFGSNDLTSFEDELDDRPATTTTGSFTEMGVTADKRFYRVVPVAEEE
ncbi:hypothetical protein N9Z02_02550 [Akkermansiaceae bacterium]|nr:hypothetical protein [Akkermansiaceae bacterium]